MSFSIISTHRFEKELKRLIKKFPSVKNEYALLINRIIGNPQTGTFIANNCYKIRLSIESKGKGKSGGARVITYLYMQTDTLYLLTIYDKSDKENIHQNEIKGMIENLDF